VDPDDLLSLASRAAREAGALLLERFRAPASGIQAKSTATDLVSDADRDAEELIRKLIRAERSEDAFHGEEGGQTGPADGLTWIIDPLDGTINFLFGLPSWCVSLAATDGSDTIAAVVYVPTLDELYSARRGGGASLNGAPISVSSRADLPTALIATGFSYSAERRREQARTVAHVLPRVRDVRRAGSASIDFVSVASGRVDGYYEGPLELWDRAPGELIATEAGAIVTSLAAADGSGDVVVAANPALQPKLAGLIEEV
jgi:myo-inositol-1(or 4)-monophosphatase